MYRISALVFMTCFALCQAASAATVAYYRFDNDSVANVTEDETGNHDGTLVGGPSY